MRDTGYQATCRLHQSQQTRPFFRIHPPHLRQPGMGSAPQPASTRAHTTRPSRREPRAAGLRPPGFSSPLGGLPLQFPLRPSPSFNFATSSPAFSSPGDPFFPRSSRTPEEGRRPGPSLPNGANGSAVATPHPPGMCKLFTFISEL